MTKTLKKGWLIVLLLGLCFVCAVLGFNTKRAFAELTDDEQTFVDNYAGFLGLADSDHDGKLSDDEIRGVMGTDADTKFVSMYMHVNNAGSSATDQSYADARGAYNNILAQYDLNGAVLLYSNLITRASYIYQRTGFSYANAEEVAGYRSSFNSMPGKDLAFLKNILNWETTWVDTNEDGIKDTPAELYGAEQKIDEWETDINNAISAIKAIQVYDNDSMMKPIFQDGEYLSVGYTVVLDSEGTINTARQAVDKVNANGDISFIEGSKSAPYDFNHLVYLTQSEQALATQKGKITKVEQKIGAAFAKYSGISGAEVCYTIKDDIEAAEKAYNDLDKDTNEFNKLKDAVNTVKADNLNTMTGKLEQVKSAINGVQGKIGQIPAKSYTYAFKSKIDEARNDFKSLPKDVRNVSEVEATRNSCVENYSKLLQAEQDWEYYVDEVNTVIEKINGLQTVAAGDLYSKIIEMYKLYTGLSDKNNQLTGDAEHDIVGVDGTLLTTAFKPKGYIDSITTCLGAYRYYNSVMLDITTAVNPIKNDIEALYEKFGGKPRFTNYFEEKISAITSAINNLDHIDGELDPRYKGAIDNYAKYETLFNKYNELLVLVNAWADAVDKIDLDHVSVSAFGKVSAAATAFDAIANKYEYNTLATDLSNFAKIYKEDVSKAYKDYYSGYDTACGNRNTIVGKLNDVVTAVNNLSRPNLPTSTYAAAETAYGTYTTNVGNAKQLYDKLSDYDYIEGETQKYFRENADYSAAYNDLVKALVNVEADTVELAIFKFSSVLEEEDYISDARTAYENIKGQDGVYTVDDVQKVVRNYKVLTDEEKKLKDWKDAIDNLLKGASFEGEQVDEIVVVAITKANVTEGFFKLDIDNANDLVGEYNDFTAVEKAYLEIAAKKDILDNALLVAGTNTGDLMDDERNKLYFIDKNIADFYDAFNNNTSLDAFPTLKELGAYVEALTNSQRALLKNTDKLSAIAGNQQMAKDLANAIDKLYDNVKDGKVNADSAMEYYILSGIYNGLSVAKQDMVKAEIKCAEKITGEDGAFEFIASKIGNTSLNVSDQINDAIKAAIAASIATIDGVDGNVKAAITKAIADAIAASIATVDGVDGNVKAAITTAIADAIAASIATVDGVDGNVKVAIETAIADAIAASLNAEAKEGNDIYQAIVKAISDSVKANGDVNKAILDAIAASIATIDGVDGNVKVAIETAIADYLKTADFEAFKKAIEQAYQDADAALRSALEEKINSEKTARENADAELSAKIDEAVADLQSKIDSLDKKSTITTIALAVVCVALCACVVVLFIKRKKA